MSTAQAAVAVLTGMLLVAGTLLLLFEPASPYGPVFAIASLVLTGFLVGLILFEALRTRNR